MAHHVGIPASSARTPDGATVWLQYVGRQVGLFRLDRLVLVLDQAALFATAHPNSGEARIARIERVPSGMLGLRRAEIEAAAVLVHPAIPSTYDVGVLDDMIVVLMEPLDARPVRDFATRVPLMPEQVVRIVASTAATMDALHARGFCHGRIWLRPDLTPVLFDFTPAPAAHAAPAYGRAFRADVLDWVRGDTEGSADHRMADIAALDAVAWWLLTGRNGQSDPRTLSRSLEAVEAALDRRFLSATAFSEAFALAVRQASPLDVAPSDEPTAAGRSTWHGAPPALPHGGHQNGANGFTAEVDPRPYAGVPGHLAPFIPGRTRTETPAPTGAPLEVHAGRLSTWSRLTRTRRGLVATLIVAAVAVSGTVAVKNSVNVPAVSVSQTPTVQSPPVVASTPQLLTAPTSAAVAEVRTSSAALVQPAPQIPQVGLVAPTRSVAEIAEQHAGDAIREAESLVAGAHATPDPDQAVLKLAALRARLAPTSQWRQQVEDLETRVLIDDAGRRVADATILKNRQLLNEAADRYERARAIRPGDDRIAPGLARKQLVGWWLDFHDAYLEHDSDRQVVALQKIVGTDPEFRTEEGSAKEKLFAALVGKAEQAWSAGQQDAARALLDQAEPLHPTSTAITDRRGLWFPAPTAIPVPVPPTVRPVPAQVPQVAAPKPAAPPPPVAPVEAAPAALPPISAPQPPTATPRPPTPRPIPPTPVPAPPPPTPVPAPPQEPASNQLVPIGPSYTPPQIDHGKQPTPRRR